MPRENQVQKLLQAELVCTCWNSHLASSLVLVPKLHFKCSELWDTDWKILPVIPSYTGQEHIGLIQGGSTRAQLCQEKEGRCLSYNLPAFTKTEKKYFLLQSYVFPAYYIPSNLEMS